MLQALDLLFDMQSKGVDYEVRSHAPVFNMIESGELGLDLDGERCKNLFLCDKKGRKFLVVTAAQKSLDLQSLRSVLDSARMSMGSPDLLYASLGVRSGSLSPLALVNDSEQSVKLVIDSELKDSEYFLLHPLCNQMTVRLRVNELVDYLQGKGHFTTWAALGGRE
ncbi:prolyl-tRNA synthetase associated domain-containing protein [Pseudomonas sp. CGJS7]|uniref:prolyl-tRNA synthetase associated domain-containing protein n=1 Tax=Pseudomonas sp. CGJS7 TaxID=3109348 RepID=UPI00300BBB2D